MKTAEVNKVEFKSHFPGLEEISTWLENNGKKLQINTISWEGNNYKPEAEVAIAYSDNEIFLKYYVSEHHFKAEKTETNQNVFEDSCVEFFVSPEDDGIYYNLEFNGIGTCLMGVGTGRADRPRVNPEIISKIRRLSSAGVEPVKEIEGRFSWTLTIAIPFDVFFKHSVKNLKGKTFNANFYKCGDKQNVPHYVTWNKVETEKPDFHQSKYFGILKFI